MTYRTESQRRAMFASMYGQRRMPLQRGYRRLPLKYALVYNEEAKMRGPVFRHKQYLPVVDIRNQPRKIRLKYRAKILGLPANVSMIKETAWTAKLNQTGYKVPKQLRKFLREQRLKVRARRAARIPNLAGPERRWQEMLAEANRIIEEKRRKSIRERMGVTA